MMDSQMASTADDNNGGESSKSSSKSCPCPSLNKKLVGNKIECKQDETESQQIDLMQLPQEVWGLILRYIPQQSRLFHRLVSRDWRDKVDTCSTFRISYNSIPKCLLPHVLQLRIRSCEFSGSRDETLLSFAQPLLVREITLGACMTPKNTQAILSSCRNVEYLRYFVTEKSDTAFTTEQVEYLRTLRKLKSIEIGILCFGRRSPTLISSCVKSLLGNPNIIFSALCEIQIHFQLTKAEWELLYAFVRRHSKTLAKVGFTRQCICGENSEINETTTIRENIKVFSECNLKSVALVKGVSNKCQCAGELLWSAVLNNQKNMESINTDVVPNVSVIEDFVKRNQHSLHSLHLHDVYLGVDLLWMDFSIFQHCSKLHSLALHFLTRCVVVINVSSKDEDDEANCSQFTEQRYSECSGLQFLPKSLKVLSIKGCDVLSSTLLAMSIHLNNLMELYLGDTAAASSSNRGEYGVTVEVLKSFLQNMPDLKSLTIHRNILNFPPDAEARMMCAIEEFGMTEHLSQESSGSVVTLDLSLLNSERRNVFVDRITKDLQ